MKIKTSRVETDAENATVLMQSGDHLTVAFTELGGMTRMVTISVQGSVMLLNDTKTNSSMFLRPGRVDYEAGK